jgi:murein DD-endopeptidase MepM/ murein hydrolase activator NlpD
MPDGGGRRHCGLLPLVARRHRADLATRVGKPEQARAVPSSHPPEQDPQIGPAAGLPDRSTMMESPAGSVRIARRFCAAALVLATQDAGAQAAPCPRRVPVEAPIARPFGIGLRPLSLTPVLHAGVVYVTRPGLTVRALGDGLVASCKAAGRRGSHLWITQRGGLRLRYGPLSTRLRPHAVVQAGAVLGTTLRTPLTLRGLRHGRWVDPLRAACGPVG